MNRVSIKENPTNIDEKTHKIPIKSDYTLVNPINISSPSDWAAYPFITGSGSDVDPYIIENIEIQGSGVKIIEQSGRKELNFSDYGIYINAEGNFTIRNCKISSISVGIFLGADTSSGYNHSIENVEINNCGMGIFSFWWHIAVNISRCNIYNCKWVAVETPNEFDFSFSRYGGFGIKVRGDTGSIVEFCQIQNCSLGILTGPSVSLIGNRLINCGFWFDFGYMLIYHTILNNTVNGKPLGLFVIEDDLTISESDASQYGQLIFLGCKNLRLSNIHITDPCSFGISLINCDHSILENIFVENQRIGFFIAENSYYIRADNLLAKDCNVGYYIPVISHSRLNKLFTENNDIPFYVISPIYNSTIEIEKGTQFYLIDYLGYETLELNSSVSSYILSPKFIAALDTECFLIQINETNTYHITDPDTEIKDIDFTIVIYQESQSSVIPGFQIFWFYIAFFWGIISLIASFRRRKRKES